MGQAIPMDLMFMGSVRMVILMSSTALMVNGERATAHGSQRSINLFSQGVHHGEGIADTSVSDPLPSKKRTLIVFRLKHDRLRVDC